LSWKDLNFNVAQISEWMKLNGINKGDRVAAYLPNLPETVIAYISTSTLGAIWSSCSPDFGTAGVIDRFSQISPKILFIGDKYFYNGKKINIFLKYVQIFHAPLLKVLNLFSRHIIVQNNILQLSSGHKLNLYLWDNF